MLKVDRSGEIFVAAPSLSLRMLEREIPEQPREPEWMTLCVEMHAAARILSLRQICGVRMSFDRQQGD